jgi:hypothetical protein
MEKKKTSKVKAIDKPKKTPVARKASKSKKVTASKFVPGEEEIRAKAMEIYHKRIALGKHGTAESDWREAEELLRGS